MAMPTTPCVTCGKQKATSKCVGCLKDFCSNHLAEHRQLLNRQLDDIEVQRDSILETIHQQTNKNLQTDLFIQQINQWEHESIQKIKTTAEEIRQIVSIHASENVDPRKDKLNKLTEELRRSRDNDDIFESNLQKWKEELEQIKERLSKPTTSNIIIQQSSTPLINKLQVEFSALLLIPFINLNAKWIANGITVAGGHGEGTELNQLNYPWNIYVDDDQTIYVADCSNHRIVEWKMGSNVGQVVAGGNGIGVRNDQLYSPRAVIVDRKTDSLIIFDQNNGRVMRWPRRNSTNGENIVPNVVGFGLSMDNDGYLYVSDFLRHEVRRWKIGEKTGTLVVGGNGPGNSCDQLNNPCEIFVDQDQSVYVSDWGNHRVMKWIRGAKQGIVVAGGQGPGNSLEQLHNPRAIVVDQLGTVYVADHCNNRVMRWLKGAIEGCAVVGGNGPGAQTNQLNGPIGLSFDRQNNLYVADTCNQRVQKFNIEVNSTS